MPTVIELPKMDTAPGGPWLAWLRSHVPLDEPFEPNESPSKARREAVMQVAVRRVAEHLRQAGVDTAKAWIKRVHPKGDDFPRLLARVYWGKPDDPYLYAFGDGGIGQARSYFPGDRTMALVWNGFRRYEKEIHRQDKAARQAVRAHDPKIKRMQRWKCQHLSPTKTLVFAGGRYFLVERGSLPSVSA